MKKTPLINSRISSVIAHMGHTDALTICDCGLPISDQAERIDLAVVRHLPGFFDVLEAVLQELCVERVVVASELLVGNPAVFQKIAEAFPHIAIEEVPHENFKQLTEDSKAIIRTGECTPYLNAILHAGTAF